MPEEATHLSLVGVCGTIALISECEVIGKVPWPEEQIAQDRELAYRLAKDKRGVF